MNRRRGQLLVEVGVCLVLLMATSGSLAVLVRTLASGREANRTFVAERLRVASTADELMAVEVTQLDAKATGLMAGGHVTIAISDRELGGVQGIQIDIQSRRFQRLALSVWRADRVKIESDQEAPIVSSSEVSDEQ